MPASFGMLIVFEIAPEMKGCAAAIMRMWLSTRKEALAGAPAGARAIEDGVMLGLQMRRAFERHGAADENIGGLDLGAGKSQKAQKIEILILQLFRRNF